LLVIAENLRLHFPDFAQVAIMFEKQSYAFDGISRNASCSELVAELEVRLGSKIPSQARLVGNGRFLQMHQTIEEVCSI
jgi:hypothetical protein